MTQIAGLVVDYKIWLLNFFCAFYGVIIFLNKYFDIELVLNKSGRDILNLTC
jgi:hypothetical protein